MEKEFSKEIKDITSEIIAGYSKGRAIDKVDLFTQPDKTEIIYILDKLFEFVTAMHHVGSVNTFKCPVQSLRKTEVGE